ncbi:MAG: hypothetical protein ACPGJS_12770 [Flammeovirgaceae bacterium]
MTFYPPEITEVDGPVIFLAGPIQGAPNWQEQAINYFKQTAPALHIASPRKEYITGTFVYAKQVDWETYFLNRASANGVVLFYLANEVEHVAGRAYAQTTRFELGEWKTKHQWLGTSLVVGIEEGFSNTRYIKRRLSQDCPQVPICSSLVETCKAALQLIREK